MASPRWLVGLVLPLAGIGMLAASASAYPTAGYTIWTVAGTGRGCSAPPNCGDGGQATQAQLGHPTGVALDSAGNMYVADFFDNEVRKVSPSGVITRFAGTGTACATPPNCGDGGPATSAQLSDPTGVAVTRSGDVLIADTVDNEIREVSPSGTITRFAGTGVACSTAPHCSDGGRATLAEFRHPVGLAVSTAGDVFIADTGDSEIREISPSGIITRFAGTGHPCAAPPNCGDNGPAGSAPLFGPEGVALDSAGNLYIADTFANEVRRVSPAGTITLFAGTGQTCGAPPSCGDGGAATSAPMSGPFGIVVRSGVVFISAVGEYEVREVLPSGTIFRIAGAGTPCATAPACGDGGAATSAQFESPTGLAVDGAGNLYVADETADQVRWLAGPQSGPQGPAGKIKLITCKTVTKTVTRRRHGKRHRVRIKVQKCTTRFVSGRVSFKIAAADRATLSRDGVVFATGVRVRGRGGRAQLALRPLRALSPGHYELSLRLRRDRTSMAITRRVTIT